MKKNKISKNWVNKQRNDLYVKQSDSSVGIGTDSPSSTLDVDGTGKFTKLEIHHSDPTLVLKDTTDDDDHEIEFQDSSGNVDYRIHTSNDIFNIL